MNNSPYKLNSDQEKAISKAREQINNGEYLSNNEANDETDEWLKTN